MLNSPLRFLYRRWRIRSLSTKLIVPSVGLTLLSLLGSTVALIGGTTIIRNCLLEEQIAAEVERVVTTLEQRVEDVATAASLLANTPGVVEAVQRDSEDALSMVNSQAMAVHDRFDLTVVQIYDCQGQACTNLMPSGLYRGSSLLTMAEPDTPVARVVGDRLVLLGRAAMPDSRGTVVVGVDLETELQRIHAEHRLSADLGLSLRGINASTRPGLPFGAPGGWVDGQYSERRPVSMGATSADLLVVRPTTDIKRVTNTGLFLMVGGTLVTTLLLGGLNVIVIRSISRPIHRLSTVAEAVAQGDLSQEASLTQYPFAIGDGDEVGLLARSLNCVIADLRDLCGSLEAKVNARTEELATAAEVARAVSSSLELDVILRRSARLIQERLGFYHVGVFLVEHDSGMAVLQEAARVGQRKPEARNVQIPLGSRSPVGIAVATGRPNVIQNVKLVPAHLKPPLLMDTYSAAAIPLLVGDTPIGALDVQSRCPNTFTPEIVRLLTSLADQIATGVHNARLYDQQRRGAGHLTKRKLDFEGMDRRDPAEGALEAISPLVEDGRADSY